MGEVVGVGARIVEYPLRLRKRPDIQMWGREVQILIPPENRFLLGEKLVITPVTSRERGSDVGILRALFMNRKTSHAKSSEGKNSELKD
jgi:hypothetical protein